MNIKKRIVVSVISDLVTDQRVHKVCQTLTEAGYDIYLIGSRKRNSLDLDGRDYKMGRIRLLFQKKVFFYAEYNTRLFFRLLFRKADILLGNDLDVMPAVWLAGKFKNIPIVYDTHEYYMAMAGLDGKPLVQRFWRSVESFIFPKLKHIYTICQSFCDLYEKDYHKKLVPVRNVPYLEQPPSNDMSGILKKYESLFPANKFILLFQGAGINQHRGAEELVTAMKWLDPQKFHLVIIGGGDVLEDVMSIKKKYALDDRITTIPKVPFLLLRDLTRKADLGLSLDKADNLNHRFGLPNKIFDYLHAGLPVLVSRLIELEKIVDEYNVGTYIDNHDPAHIAARIQYMASDPERLKKWKENTDRVRKELNWEIEGKIVLTIFKQVESEMVN